MQALGRLLPARASLSPRIVERVVQCKQIPPKPMLSVGSREWNADGCWVRLGDEVLGRTPQPSQHYQRVLARRITTLRHIADSGWADGMILTSSVHNRGQLPHILCRS
jgi:hypothetical protein